MPYLPRRVLEWALSEEHLQGRMSFIAGPRQVGKTTAVQQFLARQGQDRLYYNWDVQTVKRRYAQNPLFFLEDLPPENLKSWVALDEIHKYPRWKNILKGYYDEWHKKIDFIITGSARLDHFRKSGDSLVGRYFIFRMLPLRIHEIVGGSSSKQLEWEPGQELETIPAVRSEADDAVQSLLRLTGYPEPFITGKASFCNRWRDNHVSLILQEDLRDLTKITQVRKLETLLYLLPKRVGSPLSLNALRQPLESAHGSIRLWLEALKLVYLVFSIRPWTARLSRSILKEEKYYFWDWGLLEEPGARFENFVAVQLQRAVTAWNEQGKGPFKVYYLRTKDGEEVDFAVGDPKKLFLLVEVKEKETTLAKTLPLFQEKLGAGLAVQVVNQKGLCLQKGKGLYVLGADRFLGLLP